MKPYHHPFASLTTSVRAPASARNRQRNYRAGCTSAWLVVLCCLCSGAAHSQTSLKRLGYGGAHCATPLLANSTPTNTIGGILAAPDTNNQNTTPDAAPDDTVVISADSASSAPDNPEQIILTGAINISHQGGEVNAENARFDTRTETAIIDGAMTYKTDGLEVSSSDATVNAAAGTFELGDSGYEIRNEDLTSRGQAQGIKRNAEGNLNLDSGTYTSCPAGDNGWLISADNIDLNPDEGFGTARAVTLRFKDVPIFYAPFFSFPIGNQRKTGFLAPRIDQNDQTGLEYRQPFYWNIRPDTDATFTLRTMSERGVQIQSELRHVNQFGLWTVNHEYIGNDNRFTPGENRHYTRLRHLGGLSSDWTSSIDINNVSDADYFTDLGDTLNIASITHLERRGDLTYTAENYTFRARLLSYQTVDDTIAADDRPFQQLPELTLNYRKSFTDTGLDATVDTELVYFDRDNSIGGARVDLKPRLEWNKRRAAWYSTVAGSVRHTHYDLGEQQPQSRTVPIFSTEVGMHFDRFHTESGSVLTLEPRLYYLYARRTNQDDLPVFDTGALDFNFSQLFRENRFSGADRINDANQLTLALSSRILSREGREKFHASIGQIQYFEDRTVILPGDEAETASSSDVVAELDLEFNQHWGGSSALQWNPNTDTTERSSAEVRYRDGADRLFNVGHRFLREEGEFINASFAWPVKDNWRLAAGWNYSLDDNISIESVLGVEYEDCCWAFRVAARRYITDDGNDHINSYFFQLVLKGLAPVGQNVTEVLREAVGGYTASDEPAR